MKKTLLLAAAVVATSAFADVQLTPRSIEGLNIKDLQAEMLDAKQAKQPRANMAQAAARSAEYVTPEGEAKPYTAEGYFYSSYGLYWDQLATQVALAPDEKTVYINSLFPSAMTDIWTPGAIEGDKVTISCETVVGQYYSYYDLTIGEFILDEEGNITGYKDLVLTKEGDRYFIDDDDIAPEHYAAILAFYGGEFKGFLSYGLLLDYNPANVGEPVTLPEGAEVGDVIYSYNTYTGAPKVEKKLAAMDLQTGDIYLNGLCVGQDFWVKGTVSEDGTQVTFKGGQYLGVGAYFFYFNPFIYEGVDEEGYGIYTGTDLVFNVSEEGVFTQADENVYVSYSYTENASDIYNYGYNFVVTPYEGVVFGIPQDPANLQIKDYWDYYGQFYFGYDIVNVGTNGAYLDPEQMFYTLYIDGEPYAVGPDNFSYISEEMVEIPLNYADEQNGYDLGPGYAWIAENLFETIGVQAIYYYEGKPYYSNIVSVDIEGNVTVVEVENEEPISISTINDARNQKVIYNAMGMKVNAAERGFNIVNGKKQIVK